MSSPKQNGSRQPEQPQEPSVHSCCAELLRKLFGIEMPGMGPGGCAGYVPIGLLLTARPLESVHADAFDDGRLGPEYLLRVDREALWAALKEGLHEYSARLKELVVKEAAESGIPEPNPKRPLIPHYAETRMLSKNVVEVITPGYKYCIDLEPGQTVEDLKKEGAYIVLPDSDICSFKQVEAAAGKRIGMAVASAITHRFANGDQHCLIPFWLYREVSRHMRFEEVYVCRIQPDGKVQVLWKLADKKIDDFCPHNEEKGTGR